MTDILSRSNKLLLARLARSKLLVAFDYDGTLAPIVALPERARMRMATRRLLRSVAQRYPCIVISGRARADLIRRLRDIPLLHVSGNHGLEPGAEDARYVSRVRGWLKQLRPLLASEEGVFIEDKVYSVSLHYRAARRKRAALRTIDRAVRELTGVRRIGGKFVVNLVPSGAPDKGDVLERTRRMLVCDTALYVGDDETDEDVFSVVDRGRMLGIRVGPVRKRSRARYRLRHQSDIDALLRQLLAHRPLRATTSASASEKLAASR